MPISARIEQGELCPECKHVMRKMTACYLCPHCGNLIRKSEAELQADRENHERLRSARIYVKRGGSASDDSEQVASFLNGLT